MTSSSDNPMDVLNALMEERTRYEQWLSQLDARKATTPPHVFERVRGDYSERLKRVMDQLAGRATELQATASTLAERVASLYADETALRDERAEAELRAAVGEFAVDHAREVMQRCDEAIAALGSERASVGAELGRVQEILAAATRAPTPPAGEESIVPIETLAPPTPRGVSAINIARVTPPPAAAPAAAAPSPVAAEPPRAPAAPSFDELAFLQSVVDQPVAAAVPSGPADLPPEPAREARSDVRGDARGEPRGEGRSASTAASRGAMLEEATAQMVAQNGAASRRGAPTPVLTSAPLVSKDGQEPNPTLTPGSIPAFLKDMPTEQIKTLKCQECGTMNYPTEWYCERCGGELAAM